MKKLLAFVTAVLLAGAFVGCDDETAPEQGSIMDEGVIAEVEPVEDTMEMINLQDMTLTDALDALSQLGFNNVTYNAADFEDWSKGKIIVTGQNAEAGSEIALSTEIELTCAKLCQCYVDVTSDTNLLFDKYDMEIYLDEQKLGSVSNGNVLTHLAEVVEGEHILYAIKASDPNVAASFTFTVDTNMTFKCELKHDKAITFDGVDILSTIEGTEIEMPNVEGMVLSEAEPLLEEKGFINIREEPRSEVFILANWIVAKQNIAASSVVDKNAQIQLDCVRIAAYCETAYAGKNLAEAQQVAATSGFSLIYHDESNQDVTAAVESMSDTDKAKWTVVRSKQYNRAFKTVDVTISPVI